MGYLTLLTFFQPNAEGVSPHDFVIDAVNRKVCSYKNFSSEFLDSCEYKVSNITGFCSVGDEEESGNKEIKNGYSQSNYFLYGSVGLVATFLLLYVVRFLFRRSKAKGYKRQLESAERSTLDLVATDKYGAITVFK